MPTGTYVVNWSPTIVGKDFVYPNGMRVVTDDVPSGVGANGSIRWPHLPANSSTTTLSLPLTLAADGSVSFYRKVASEAGWDGLRFFVDGVQKEFATGTVAWAQVSFPVAAGAHTFEWRYTKDSSGSVDVDTAWLALLSITNVEAPPPLSASTRTTAAYDFEDGLLPAAFSGTWEPSASEPLAGSTSLRTPPATAHSSTYTTNLAVDADENSVVSFNWAVSSEASDGFSVLVGSTLCAPATGGTGSGTYHVIVPAATSTVTFKYAKDALTSGGSDAAWIDDVSVLFGEPGIEPDPSASLTATLQTKGTAFTLAADPAATLAGVLRAKAAAFSVDVPASLSFGATLQTKTAAFGMDLSKVIDLAATLPAKSAAFGLEVVPATDTGNRVGGRSRSGYGRAEWSPAVVTVPSGLDQGKAVVSAHAYGAVTMRGTQPTFAVSEASKPRDRQRILIGGQDVTYFRGALTPEVPYQLADPLLWGPATIEFPQIAAAFEKPGAKPLKWLRFGANVVIQRVDESGSVTATDYRGVVIAFGANGGALTVECGGQAQGRAALRDRQVPIFQFVHDVGWYAWTAIASLGLQLSPRGGPDTGIEFGRSGGMSHLDYIRELCGRAQTKSGKRWTIMPNDAGVYRMTQKDTTTVDATIFCDDARAVANLRRDMAEEPNRIFATGVTPEGKRIRFGAYPGLKHGDAPPFPNTDGRAIREGHTNADTDSGDGVSVLRFRLRHTGYLSFDDAPGGYDRDMTRAVRHLQADADLAETGNVNEATWEALFDLNVTGYSLRFAGITPAAERSRVRSWRRAASGAIIARNPNYDRNALKVDRTVDMGTGFWRGQIREWASAELADSTLPNWVGTIEVRTGAVLAGQVAVGATVSAADVMDVRDLRPGMNVWLPQFDGGTLLHVSGIDVSATSTRLTVDTRARDALEVWEVITRNRETRNNPARAWRGPKSSTEDKDSLDVWDEVGGILYGDVDLVPGWNVVPIVAGQAGTVSQIRLELGDKVEFACAVFGGKVAPKRLNHLIDEPLTKAGTEKWEKRAVRKVLDERGLRYAAGTKDEPCGYSPGRKVNDEGNRSDHPLRGVHEEGAGFSYLCAPGRPVLYLAVWVPSATTLKRGRVMWNQLEGGV